MFPFFGSFEFFTISDADCLCIPQCWLHIMLFVFSSAFVYFCFFLYKTVLLFLSEIGVKYRQLITLVFIVWRLKNKPTGRFLSRNRLQQQHSKVNEKTSDYCTVSAPLWAMVSGTDLFTVSALICQAQGDHLSGKPENVWEFDSCVQGNARDFTKSQGNVTEKVLSGKCALQLFIVSCLFASILDFAELSVSFWFRIISCTVAFLPPPLTLTLNNNNNWYDMSNTSHGQECHEPSWNCQGISHHLESGHPAGVSAVVRRLLLQVWCWLDLVWMIWGQGATVLQIGFWIFAFIVV